MPCQQYTLGRMGGAVRRVVFEVRADPRRRRILDLLRDRERPVGDLVDVLRVSQPAVSKHLRVLRDAGLVEARVDAQRRLYRVRAEPLRLLDDWLAPYRAMWTSRLDALAGHLAAMSPDPATPPSGGAISLPPEDGRRLSEVGLAGNLEQAGG